MVSILRYIFFIGLFILTACVKSQFVLDFNLAPEITENYNVTYYATDTKGGLTVQAVASVREGKCLLNGITKKPTILYVTERNSNLPLVIYAERGNKIKISGNSPDPISWTVEGNKINEELSAWRNEYAGMIKSNDKDSVNLAVEKYVKENSSNPVSTLLLLCYYDRSEDDRGYTSLMYSLKGEAAKVGWLELVGRSDQLSEGYFQAASLHSVALRSNKDGADTVRTDGKNPVFMLFWQTGYDSKKEMIDSLKSLEKEYKDSVSIIADVCMDIDSIGWRSAIRNDSLKSVKRLWVPLGMTDPQMMKLKIQSLPYFIVFDKEGQQVYRGNKLYSAIKKYRELQNSSDTIR